MSTRDEDGLIGGMEGVVFGVLVFVFGTLLVANTWSVVDAKMAASAAAREATRTFVEAPDQATGLARARAAAVDAIVAHGRDPARMGFDNDDVPLVRCGPAELRVTYTLRILGLPVIGRQAGTITVTATHAEIGDPYRSGLPGTCDLDPIP